jgi:16S rRNA processing protein RimM
MGAVVVRAVDEEVDRFDRGLVLGTDNPEFPQLTVGSVRQHKDGLLVLFEELANRNEAEVLRGTSLLVSSQDRRQLDDDEYWPEQLVGLRVVDSGGEQLGVVSDLVVGSAQDRLVVTAGETIVEVPFVAALVPSIDLVGKVVVVDAPEGLF